MYEAYFGFRHAPFGVTPDPRFLFRNARYEEALSTLLYGIRERKGFVLLTGEVGTGKTTLLHTVIAELANTPFVFVFNPVADFDQLLMIVCDELGLAPQRNDRPARLEALNRFLTDQLRAGRTTALLIDEGQNLPAQTLEDLRLLSNLEIPTEKLLQIVLVGQPELAARLAEPSLRQLRQRIALRYELKGLTVQEVGDFVRHRLMAAGATDEGVIEPNAISQIARLSGGIPRLVNMICDNALLVCYGSSQRRVTPAIVDEVAADLRLADPAPAEGKSLDEARHEIERFDPQAQHPVQKVLPAMDSPLDETNAAKALVAILESLHLRYGALLRYHPDSQSLKMLAQEGLAERAIDAIRTIRRDVNGVWDMPLRAVQQRRVYIIDKPKENPFVPTLLPGSEQASLTNAAVIPLSAAGSVTGALLLVGNGARAIHETDVFALREAARNLGAALRLPPRVASRPPYLLTQPVSEPPRRESARNLAILTARVSELESLVESLRRGAEGASSSTETERRLAQLGRERDHYKSESALHEIALRDLHAAYDLACEQSASEAERGRQLGLELARAREELAAAVESGGRSTTKVHLEAFGDAPARPTTCRDPNERPVARGRRRPTSTQPRGTSWPTN